MQPYTPAQLEVLNAPAGARLFVEGPAGSGKTTAAVARLAFLLRQGVPADEILLLVPQRTLAQPYLQAIHAPDRRAGGVVDVFTLGGLARQMTELFWPLVAGEAGFSAPERPPTFLNIETAQYHMAAIVRPLLEKELYFEGVALDRNRLYSQILDNLNKSAIVGFPHTEIGARLSAAWVDQSRQRRIYDDVQDCANRFRAHCLAHNLLDFSLVLELFNRFLWPSPVCYGYLTNRYRHLVYDNIEEDTPAAHDLVNDWLPDFESALLLHDWEAGFRQFLGADPGSAANLRMLCSGEVVFTGNLVSSPAIEGVRGSVAYALNRPESVTTLYTGAGLSFEPRRFYPEMLGWVGETIRSLVFDDGVPPGEIVVLAPFLSDALRFSLMHQLELAGIPAQSHRPSRSLREEPAVQCLLTLAALVHPEWGLRPVPFDVAYALRQAIAGLDLVRAQLLTEVLYQPGGEAPALLPFDRIRPDMQARITFSFGERTEVLRRWLEEYPSTEFDAPDLFFSRLFGEVLSQSGFGFHADTDAGKASAHLIDSAREFRRVVGPQLLAAGQAIGRAFAEMVRDGVLAAQNIRSWETQQADAVLVAPAYTFLMSNRPVEYQFWLNVSSKGWGERLYQPLTNPHVLSRGWEPGRVWTDEEDRRANEEALFKLVNGLLRRCRTQVFLGLSEMDEHGYEQKGPLLAVLQRVLRTGITP